MKTNIIYTPSKQNNKTNFDSTSKTIINRFLLVSNYLLFLVFLLLSNTNIQAQDSNHCNKQDKIIDPGMGTNVTLDEAFKQLTPYNQIGLKLTDIKKNAHHINIKAGPLIKNGNNEGLINIDTVHLSNLGTDVIINRQVCGPNNPNPTAREAVICTIGLDAVGRGNTDPAKIGFSTNNRELMGARIGNPKGLKVLVITQQHGNEPFSTEAALNILKKLTTSKSDDVKEILKRLDILFVIRANPDGGEPDLANCPTLTPVGKVFTGTCAMTRESLDPKAGGAFKSNSEVDFNGVVGVGYNLNRYNYAGLDHAIRPVESQAIIAVALAFQPDAVWDLHGDVPKTECALDPSSLKVILPGFNGVNCLTPDSPDNSRLFSVFNDDKPISKAVATVTLKKVDKTFKPGKVGRFAQLQSGTANGSSGDLNSGTADAITQKLGGIRGGWEVNNFNPEFRPAVLAIVAGKPTVGFTNYLINPNITARGIAINEAALMSAFKGLVKFGKNEERATAHEHICSYPLATAMYGRLPAELFGPNPGSVLSLLPLLPSPPYNANISGNYPCPGDL